MTMVQYKELGKFVEHKTPFTVSNEHGKKRLFCPASELFNFQTLCWFIEALEKEGDVVFRLYDKCKHPDKPISCSLYSPTTAKQICEEE